MPNILRGMQAFFAAHGLHGLQAFFAAHGLQASLAAHGLHGLHVAASISAGFLTAGGLAPAVSTCADDTATIPPRMAATIGSRYPRPYSRNAGADRRHRRAVDVPGKWYRGRYVSGISGE